MDILLKINDVIKEKRLSQKEIAEKLGVSKQVMSNLLSGKTEISVNLLFKIAEAINVSVLYILTFSDDMFKNVNVFDSADYEYLIEQIKNRSLSKHENDIKLKYHILTAMSKHDLIDQILYKFSNDKFLDERIKTFKREIELLNETNKALKGENEALKTLLKNKTIL